MTLFFRPKIVVPHGRYLAPKYADKITARSILSTDRNGNTLSRFSKSAPYFQQWRIVKETKGWIFREVTNGAGICGHHPTIRELVIVSSRFNYITIQIDL